MTTPGQSPSKASEKIARFPADDVRSETARAINSARLFIVKSMFALIGLTGAAAVIGASFGRASSWGQLSPVIDTLLAGEFAALGAVLAFYMAKQD